MSKKSNGQALDGSKVHPSRDDDSAVVPQDRSRGLASPRPGRRRGCLARAARGPQGRHLGDGQNCQELMGWRMGGTDARGGLARIRPGLVLPFRVAERAREGHAGREALSVPVGPAPVQWGGRGKVINEH